MDQLITAITTMKGQLDSTSSDMKNQIGSVSNQISDVNTKFEVVSNKVDAVSKKFESVQKMVDTLKSDVARQLEEVHTELATQIVETQIDVRREVDRVRQEVTTQILDTCKGMRDAREEFTNNVDVVLAQVDDIRDRIGKLERPTVASCPPPTGDDVVVVLDSSLPSRTSSVGTSMSFVPGTGRTLIERNQPTVIDTNSSSVNDTSSTPDQSSSRRNRCRSQPPRRLADMDDVEPDDGEAQRWSDDDRTTPKRVHFR